MGLVRKTTLNKRVPNYSLVIACTGTPCVVAYRIRGDRIERLPPPATLPGSGVVGRRARFSDDGRFVAITSNTSPFLQVYRWEKGFFGEKLPDPAVLPTGDSRRVRWSPDGRYIAVAMGAAPWVHVYEWSDAGFGSKVSDPASSPVFTSVCNVVEWSRDGLYLGLCGNATLANNRTCFYEWNNGFGSKITSPVLSVNFGTEIRGLEFNPNGSHVVVQDSGQWQSTFAFASGVFDSGVELNTTAGPSGDSIRFHPDGQYFAAAVGDSQAGHSIFKFMDGSPERGSLLIRHKANNTGTPSNVEWSPDGKLLVFSNSLTPFLYFYRWDGGLVAHTFGPPAQLPPGAVNGLSTRLELGL